MLRVTIFTLVCLFLVVPVTATSFLKNGDFELAGPRESSNAGPGWLLERFIVLGPASPQGACPLSGWKAMGTYSYEDVRNGNLKQTVPLKSGYYKIITTGYIWTYDNGHFPSFFDIYFHVDGRRVRFEKVSSSSPGKWTTVRMVWRGFVNKSVTLDIFGQADGRGSGGWGVVATDCWSMEVIPNPPKEENLFTNGGFEQAGEPGSRNIGGGWKVRNKVEVFSYGCFKELIKQFGPYEGRKAVEVLCNTDDDSGFLEQHVNFKPGNYELRLSGKLYQWDTYGGDQYNTYSIIEFVVDGKVVQKKRICSGDRDSPTDRWGGIQWVYVGPIKKTAGVRIECQARGAGDTNSWTLAALDDWVMTAKPLKNSWQETSLLKNGDFEDTGPCWSYNQVEGWNSTGKIQVWEDDCLTKYPSTVSLLRPYSGRKAVGVVANTVDDTGILEQTIKLSPGCYDIILSGHLFHINTYGATPDCVSHTYVSLIVDRKDAISQRIATGDEGFWEEQWNPLLWHWRGWVEDSVTVKLDARATARGDVNSWALIGYDDFTLQATRCAPRKPPRVIDDGAITTSKSLLHARWESEEKEAQYQYAIGLSKGGTEIVDWTDVGYLKEITKTGLSLSPGTSVFFSVRALDKEGFPGPVGYSDGIMVK